MSDIISTPNISINQDCQHSGRNAVVFERKRNWSGRGVVYERGYTCFAPDVQKFEIDEEHGLILKKSSTNLFSVRTLDDSMIIWSQQDVSFTLIASCVFVHSTPFVGQRVQTLRAVPARVGFEHII